jgi:hypothetical protein
MRVISPEHVFTFCLRSDISSSRRYVDDAPEIMILEFSGGMEDEIVV